MTSETREPRCDGQTLDTESTGQNRQVYFHLIKIFVAVVLLRGGGLSVSESVGLSEARGESPGAIVRI